MVDCKLKEFALTNYKNHCISIRQDVHPIKYFDSEGVLLVSFGLGFQFEKGTQRIHQPNVELWPLPPYDGYGLTEAPFRFPQRLTKRDPEML